MSAALHKTYVQDGDTTYTLPLSTVALNATCNVRLDTFWKAEEEVEGFLFAIDRGYISWARALRDSSPRTARALSWIRDNYIKGGSVTYDERNELIVSMYEDDEMTLADIAEQVGLTPTTVRNYLLHAGVAVGKIEKQRAGAKAETQAHQRREALLDSVLDTFGCTCGGWRVEGPITMREAKALMAAHEHERVMAAA